MSFHSCLPRFAQQSSHLASHGAAINDLFRRNCESELYPLFRKHEDSPFKLRLNSKADIPSLAQTFLAEKEGPRPSRSEDETKARQWLGELDIFAQCNWSVLLEDLSSEQFRLLQQQEELASELTSGFCITLADLDKLPGHLADDLSVVKELKTKNGSLPRGSEVFRIGQHSVKTKEELLERRDEMIEFRTIGGVLKRQLYGTSLLPIPIRPREASSMTESRRQFLIERKGYADAVKEFREMQNSMKRLGLVPEQQRAHAVWIRWANQMIPKIKEAQEQGKIAPFLGADVLAVVTCRAALNIMLTPKHRDDDKAENSLEMWKKMEGCIEPPAVTNVALLATKIGEAINFEWNCKSLDDKIKTKDENISHDLVKRYRSAKLNADRRGILKLLAVYHNASWDEFEVRVPLGAELLKILIDTAKVDADFHEAKQELATEHQKLVEAKMRRQGKTELHPDDIPKMNEDLLKSDTDPSKVSVHAFYHRLLYKDKKTFGQVAMRHVAEKALRGELGELAKAARAVCQPMIKKPLPWKNVRKGAFHVTSAKFVRHQGIKAIDYDFQCYDHSRVAKIMDSLSAVPWRINQRIVDCIQRVIDENLQIAGIPDAENDEVPTQMSKEEFYKLPVEERQKIRLNMANIIRNNEKLSSSRPSLHLKMQSARNFYHAERIYYPHNVDYRGRSYPLPPHLNHQGDDVSRGLLMFSNTKPLGADGLRWLKISLANLYGKDKLTFADRVKWTEDNMDRIRKAAADPFDPDVRDWWAVAGDGPWQFLARCMELSDALDSPDPLQFQSSQPVHMDGSCNGLQHYAALGRDVWGAKSVNLLPGDKVEDVYMEVLHVVEKRVMKHSLDPITGPNAKGRRCVGELSRLALELNVLERKTVKQTVMTICYGVTTIGAKDQVQARLMDKVGETVDPQIVSDLARYLSKVILSSIGEVFQQAMQIKCWFDSASAAFNKTGTTVSWMSPLGFAVRQPYYEFSKKIVRTTIQNIHLTEKTTNKVKKASQRSGFPPNFVHSLDATHMMMTAERCLAEGLDFAGVHDSFWTHACDVTRMNEILRDAFIDLHSAPILRDLDKDFRVRLGEHAENLPELPPLGELDLEEVRNSQYFFD